MVVNTLNNWPEYPKIEMLPSSKPDAIILSNTGADLKIMHLTLKGVTL